MTLVSFALQAPCGAGASWFNFYINRYWNYINNIEEDCFNENCITIANCVAGFKTDCPMFVPILSSDKISNFFPVVDFGNLVWNSLRLNKQEHLIHLWYTGGHVLISRNGESM